MLRTSLLAVCSAVLLNNIALAQEPIQPLPESVKLNPEKVSLGQTLFSDPRLSKNNTISCASCHDLKSGGRDKTSVSVGIYGQKGDIRAPTVYNAVFNFRQFWNGRAANLKEQAKGPVANPKEMGSEWPDVINKLKSDPNYVKAFKAVYGQDITEDNVVDAIAEFEHSLITPSRFDDYLRGNKSALSSQEKHGYELFKSYGCIACHNGMNIGGGMYMKMGVAKDYFSERGKPVTSSDTGRFEITKQQNDMFVFKVPTLRNVALTPPYYHDGSVATLDQAIYKMGKYQLGKEIPEKDRKDIAAFLESLTGKKLQK